MERVKMYLLTEQTAAGVNISFSSLHRKYTFVFALSKWEFISCNPWMQYLSVTIDLGHGHNVVTVQM